VSPPCGRATGRAERAAVVSMRRAACGLVGGAFLAASFAALAQGEDELVALINARRADAHGCGGAAPAVLAPLAPSAVLAGVDDAATPGDLGKALTAAGYLAAAATTIVISGPKDAAAAARFLDDRDCATLLDARYAEIGVARAGSTWRIHLARPLLAHDLGDWQSAGKAVLGLVNEARAHPRICGTRRFDGAPPLRWNEALAAAALAHSRDMATNNYFEHADRAGATVVQRAGAQGYRWHAIGENIAAGIGSPAQAVAGWLASPGHCANIMSRDFADMGAAYAVNPQSAMEVYWTQAFGRP
jgi:uncharacterized protein YkwD